MQLCTSPVKDVLSRRNTTRKSFLMTLLFELVLSVFHICHLAFKKNASKYDDFLHLNHKYIYLILCIILTTALYNRAL